MVTSDGRSIGRAATRANFFHCIDILDEGQPRRSIHRLLLLLSGIKRVVFTLERGIDDSYGM